MHGRDALVREKRREDRLRAMGYFVVRLTWADLNQPDLILSKIGAAVAASRTGAVPSGIAPTYP